MERREINVVVYREDGLWIAQCLEYDIAVRAQSIPTLRQELVQALLATITIGREIGQDDPLSHLGSAPAEFWEKYEEAETWLDTPRMPLRAPMAVPRFETAFRLYEAA